MSDTRCWKVKSVRSHSCMIRLKAERLWSQLSRALERVSRELGLDEV
jgi:hypothetical protein